MKTVLIRFRTLVSVLVLLLIVGLVSAHEGREVGDYTIEIGWRVEPAYTGLMNGPEITVSLHEESEAEHTEEAADNLEESEATAEAEHSETGADDHEEAENSGVAGLDISLQVEVIFGPSTRTFNLRPVIGEPGRYTADLIPMRPCDYSFRVFGTIEGMSIDETFSASDGQFSTVEPIEDIQFP